MDLQQDVNFDGARVASPWLHSIGNFRSDTPNAGWSYGRVRYCGTGNIVAVKKKGIFKFYFVYIMAVPGGIK